MDTLVGYVDGLPSLCGQELLISEAIEAGRQRPVFPGGADTERAASTQSLCARQGFLAG